MKAAQVEGGSRDGCCRAYCWGCALRRERQPDRSASFSGTSGRAGDTIVVANHNGGEVKGKVFDLSDGSLAVLTPGRTNSAPSTPAMGV
jgi:hypothetical protein